MAAGDCWGNSWLATWGTSWAQAGDAPVVVPTASGGGIGHGRRRSKYPRRVSIDGRLVLVQTAEEERRLLAAWAARLEARNLALEVSDAAPAKVAAVRVKLARVERRVAKVDEREAAWRAKLQSEDEELLLILH